MNWASWLLWGFVSTLLMTTMEAASQELGLTRIDFPFILGTIFTPDRDRAKIYGFIVHVAFGLVFSLLYVLAFESWRRSNWWLGSIIGVAHASFVLLVLMWLLPGVHPRMASENHGPTVTRQLEPPGFLGLNYGIQTPISVLISHVVFGTVLGACYRLSGTGRF